MARGGARRRAVIAGELDLAGAESDPELMEGIVSAMEGRPRGGRGHPECNRSNERLASRPELMAAIRRLDEPGRVGAGLIPVLRWPVIRDAEVVSIVLRSWPRLAQPQRLLAIEALLARPALVDVANPREAVMQVLRRGVTDPSAAVRERTLRGINALPALWGGKGSTSLLLAALADDTPALRQLGLTLASTKPGFWARADAREYLKRLLIDPDPEIRLAALEAVEHHALIRAEPALARRVKVLETDPELARRARQVLASAGIDDASIEADAASAGLGS